MKLSIQARTGILVTIVAFGIYAGINFMKGMSLFESQKKYYIKYERIDGLELSSPIEIRGLKVGQVSDIQFESDNYRKIVVSVLIRGDIALPQETIGRIYSSDLMGTKSIELIMGGGDAFMQSGDTIGSEIEGSISDQVKLQMLPLKRKAEDLMGSMEEAITAVKEVLNEKTGKELRGSLKKVQVAIDAFKHAATNLDTVMVQSKGKFSKILSNVQSISKNIENNNENISSILDHLDLITDSLSRSNITQTINNLNKTLVQTEVLMREINSGEGSIGKLIYEDSLYNNLMETTANFDKLLIDINENPGRYVHVSFIDLKSDKKQKK